MRATNSVGFISTRLAGTDGVSLESAKWEAVLERNQFTCRYLSGELDRPSDRSILVEEVHFSHPRIQAIQQDAFRSAVRSPELTAEIHAVKDRIKKAILSFFEQFHLDLLVVENALAIPMNIPLGMALTEVIAETGMPTIAHHHDFFWERERFLTNCVWDYLNMAFPPHIPFVRHVVINSSANNQLSLRTGISATTIPNVMDFENPPPPPDGYAADIREALDIGKDEAFILQPTRVVKRKGIENAIELVSRLGIPAKLVISHASGDEGDAYERRVREYSKALGVNTVFVSERIGERRGLTKDGEKIYTLQDVYPHVDLVTYPSTFEGFGNAFLETIYFSKPIVVNNYSIYRFDIRPKGFRCIELDGYVTDETVRQTLDILSDARRREAMTQHNYEVARESFSFGVLERKLRDLVDDMLTGAHRRNASRRRAEDNATHCCVCARSIQKRESRRQILHVGRRYVACCPLCAGEFRRRPDRYVGESTGKCGT